MANYIKTESGTLEIIDLPIVDGQPYAKAGYPLENTGEVVQLMGWPDSQAQVWVSDGGQEYLIGLGHDQA